MRIRHTPFFPLKLDIQHTNGTVGDCEFLVYNSQMDALAVEKVFKKDTYRLEIDVTCPVKLLIKFQSKDMQSRLELINFKLAGINVEKSKLINCLEYKFDTEDSGIELSYIDTLPSEKTVVWGHRGYVIVDLFHPNPFSWHLYLGNNIKF